ncbi:MAG: hypothetical protein ACUVXI_00945 [bacterium]
MDKISDIRMLLSRISRSIQDGISPWEEIELKRRLHNIRAEAARLRGTSSTTIPSSDIFAFHRRTRHAIDHLV